MFSQTQALLFFGSCIQNILAFPRRLKKLCPHSSVFHRKKRGPFSSLLFFQGRNILQKLNRLPVLCLWLELDKGSPLNQSLTNQRTRWLFGMLTNYVSPLGGSPLPWEPCQRDKAGILLARKGQGLAIGQEIKRLVTLSLSFLIWQVGKTKLITSLLWRSTKDKISKKLRKDIFRYSLPCNILNWLED